MFRSFYFVKKNANSTIENQGHKKRDGLLVSIVEFLRGIKNLLIDQIGLTI